MLGEIVNIKESDIPNFARFSDEAHRYGAKLSTELYHVSGIGLTDHEGFDHVEINLDFTK